MTDLWQDFRFGFRLIRKNWTFSAIAVLTLALGVGANGAIFSIVNAVLLHELPYPEPDELVMVWESRPREGVTNNVVSPADFRDWRDRQQVFDAIAAYIETPMDLSGSGEPVRLSAGNVSASFFKTFGVAPALGRDFTSDEEQRGRNHVVIINHGLWLRQFGGDPNIVGKRLILSGDPYEVIGVMPASFRFPNELIDLWFPLDFTTESMRARFNHFLNVYARLKPGVTVERAQADMDRISAQLQSEVELQNQGHGAHVIRLQEDLVGDLRSQLFILLAAVGFVLLIACVNVANLLLARGAARSRELAIRTALGAGRFRIVRQLLMECLWLAFLSVLAGVPLAIWGVDLLRSIVPGNIPRLNDAGLDFTVLGYMIAVALVTGMIFGLAPALQSLKVNPNDTLKASNPTAGVSRRRLRNALVVSEIALAFVLLIGAGLMMRSLFNLLNVDSGVDPNNVLTMNIALSRTQVTPQRSAVQFFQELLERVRSLPGVTSAGLTTHLPMSGMDSRTGFVVEGRESSPDNPVRAHWRIVTPEYFPAMRIRLSDGRFPTEQELQNRAFVAVINRAAAERYWPGQNPIGKRLRILSQDWREIVGVIQNVRHWGLANPVNPEVYIPGFRTAATMVVRTSQDPTQLARPIREQVRQLSSELPLGSVRTMEEIRGRSVASPRFYLTLLGVFGLVSLILACAGIYGVMSYTVNQSTREIGVRIAMGAKPGDVVRLFVREGLILTLISLALGAGAAFGLTRVMTTLLFGVTPTDPLTFLGIAVLTGMIALVACYVPARRASRVDPLIALKHE